MTGGDIAALHKQLLTLEETRRLLAARLELTVNALAITLDAQASTQLRIDGSSASGNSYEDNRQESIQRRRETERYRTVLGLLAADGEDLSDVMRCYSCSRRSPTRIVRTHAPGPRSDESTRTGLVMAGRNKGGREARKPKQDQNKKQKGQTPPAGTATPPVTQTPRPPAAR